MADYNPIMWVKPILSDGTDGDEIIVPSPSEFQYDLQDVSSSDAGRSESGQMYKNRIGQTVKIELKWWNITTAECSAILNAFNSEYFKVRYLDPMVNGYVTHTFYAGDRTAPMYNARMGLWKELSFNIIQRYAV